MIVGIYKQIFEQSTAPVAVFNHDEQFTLAFFNASFEKVSGGQDKLITGVSIFSILQKHAIDPGILKTQLRVLCTQGTAFDFDLNSYIRVIFAERDHEKGVRNYSFKPLLDDEGAILYFSLTVTQNNADHLHGRIGLFESILDKLPIGIAVHDEITGKSVFVSSVYGEIFGHNVDQFTDINTFFKLVFPDKDEREGLLAKINADMESGDSDRMSWNNLSIITKNGGKRIVNTRKIIIPEKHLVVSTAIDITESARKNEEVHQLKQIHEAIVNATTDHIWATDKDRLLLTANESFKKIITSLTGVTPKRGDPISSIGIDAIKIKKWDELYNRVFAGETVKFIEEALNLENNQMVYGEITISPLRDEPGDIIGLAAFSKDISESMRRRIELEQAKDDLKNIVDTSLDIICTVDLEGRYVRMNSAVERLWGYKPEEVEGMSFIDFIHPDYHAISKLIAQELALGKPISEFENKIVHKDGSTIPMVWTAKWDEATQLMYCVARDATERKRAEAAADEVHRRYERIFQDAPAFICALAPIGNDPEQIEFEFQMANHEFSRLFKKKDILGKPLLDIFPEIKNTEIASIIQQVYTTLSTFEATEMPFNIGNGNNEDASEKYLSFVLSADKATNKSVKGLFIFGIDVTEQVESRKKILFANDRYAAVSRATFDAVWDWDIQTDTIDWGEGFKSVFGHSLANSQSELSFWSDLVHPDDEESALASLEEAQHSESGIWNAEYRFKKADGIYAHVVDRGVVIKDHRGKQLRMVGAMQDVSTARQLEKLLTRTSKMARIGAWELYPVTGNISFSEVLVDTLEVPSGMILDLHALKELFLKSPMENTFAECLLNAVDKGESWDEEAQILTFSGRTMWVRSKGEAEMLNGLCTAIYASIQDIDHTKTTQIELAETYAEKEDILESIGDAFFALDDLGRVTYWNRMAEKLSGVKREALIGKDFIASYPFELNKKYFEMAKILIENRQTINFESYNERQNIWLEFTAYPSAKGISVYFRDITSRKIAEENLLALNERLQLHSAALIKSNKELEQFAYVASHDLQEPLRMVSGFLSQLEKKYASELDDQARKYIHYAVDGATRMRTIILDLLEYSRAGSEMKMVQDVDMNLLVHDVLELFKKDLEDADAIVECSELPIIKAYKSPMMQVFQNLIGNSLKYAYSGRAPVITINSIEGEEHHHFTVSDNGMGINPEYFERIFEMFQRLHSRENYPGTGMGLALTKKIIENMDGRIWVESEEGKGSTFHFTLKKQ